MSMKNVFLLFIFAVVLTAFAEGQVISLNKPISAVSVWGEGYEAEKANDGDLTTRWAASNEVGDKWIIIDLEQVSDISAVRIVWEVAYSTDFTIDVSNDQTNWTVAQTVTGHAAAGDQDLTGLAASGRYVRLYSTAGVNGGDLSIFEFSVYGSEGPPAALVTADTISLYKPVTTSSIYGAGYEGSLAVDGDRATRWASGEGLPHWIIIDLEDMYNIDSLRIDWEGSFGADFTIDVSEDGSAWTSVVTVVGAEIGGQQSYPDLATTGQFVRLNITANGNTALASVWEFSVFGSIDPVSLNKPVTSSSIYGAGYEGSLAVDGNRDTRWASGEGLPHWIIIDLEDMYNIESVQIEWEDSFGADFTIDVSEDGSAWTSVVTVVGAEIGGPQSYPDLATTGQFVRLNITANGNTALASVWELSVFGSMKPSTTAIKDYFEISEGIKVFPNPATDFFRITTTDDSEAKLSVYELTGRLVYSDIFVKTKLVNSKEFGASGIFIIKVETETNIYSERVIVK